MEKQLMQIAGETIKLFDGLEDNLFDQEFDVTVRDYGKVSIKCLNLIKNKFKHLDSLIGVNSVKDIVESKHFPYENGIFPGYVGTDKLNLYFASVENILLIFSMGEYQPARYILYFEGAWQVK